MTNTETNGIGPRPSNPAEISFDDRCFEQVGERVEYSVTRSALHSAPARFSSAEDAREYARKTGRVVTVAIVPVRKRISWR